MIDSLLDFIAPHPCYGCGKVGSPLCGNCKYNIESEPFSACVVCGSAAGKNGICIPCRTSYTRAWCVGERSDSLQRLVDAYKFERARACHVPLADLLVECLPELPTETIVIPIPTISVHIRQRCYDHSLLLARRVAKKMNLTLATPLSRKTSTIQRGANRRERIKQAKDAFQLDSPLLINRPYLLIDDVITTGSTVQYAAQLLKDAGVAEIWVAVVARQVSTK